MTPVPHVLAELRNRRLGGRYAHPVEVAPTFGRAVGGWKSFTSSVGMKPTPTINVTSKLKAMKKGERARGNLHGSAAGKKSQRKGLCARCVACIIRVYVIARVESDLQL